MNSDGSVTKVEQGLMPSKGNIKILVLPVEFPDEKHDEGHTVTYIDNLFFGEKDRLSEYYQNASYGQLNLSGEVKDWYTTSHERSYYERSDLGCTGPEAMLAEILKAYMVGLPGRKCFRVSPGL